MIKKVTILNSRAMTYEFNEFKQQTEQTNLELAGKEFTQNAEYFAKAARVMDELRLYPDVGVENAIKLYFGANTKIDIKKKSKTSRTYSIYGGLYIHEEDQSLS